MYCIPTMRSDVWPQTSLAGLLNSAGLQTNFRHLGASQMAFVLLRCGRVGVGRPITYASELDYLYLHSMCNMYIIYIHICKYDFKYVCNICTSSIDSGTCTRIWSYVHMEGCGLGWAVNVCWELRTDLKLFQAGGTLPWCLQAHQNIKLLEVQAITRPWHSHVCQNVKFRNWVTPRKKLTQRLRHKIHMTYENTPWDTIVLYITKDTRD